MEIKIYSRFGTMTQLTSCDCFHCLYYITRSPGVALFTIPDILSVFLSNLLFDSPQRSATTVAIKAAICHFEPFGPRIAPEDLFFDYIACAIRGFKPLRE